MAMNLAIANSDLPREKILPNKIEVWTECGTANNKVNHWYSAILGVGSQKGQC